MGLAYDHLLVPFLFVGSILPLYLFGQLQYSGLFFEICVNDRVAGYADMQRHAVEWVQ